MNVVPPQSPTSPQRHGFSLFEIAIALGLVALSVTSVLLLFPLGIKAQQMARFRLYAATKAEDLIEAFAATHNTHTQTDVEAFNPWDVPVSYRNMAHDLETRVGNPEFGLMPLPPDLARRLDSDGDEINRILDEGGALYYSAPMATSGVVARSIGAVSSNEVQKVLVAVTGYPQHDMMQIFPWKAVPYYYPYPSPPQHGLHFKNQYLPSDAIAYDWVNRYGSDKNEQYCSEAVEDPDCAIVFSHDESGVAYGFKPYAYDYAYDDAGAGEAQARATRYLQSALWYATKKGLPPGWIDPGMPATPRTAFATADRASELRAMRFIAHAGACLTRWYSDGELASGLATVPPVTLAGHPSASAPITVTQALIIYWHESCLNLAMRFCAEDPYDWGAPRPLQRTQMMDYPLLEYDLMSPATRLKGTLFGQPARAAEQWRPISANPVTNVGRGFQFAEWPADIRPDEQGVDPAERGQPIWGDARHGTLTEAFAPDERCRQLVFWAVDWQSYEDFETCPSAPLDAARYNFASELKTWWNVPGEATTRTFEERMSDVPWSDPSLYIYRNPEKNLVFREDISGLSDGDPVNDKLLDNRWDGTEQGAGFDKRKMNLGRYGADRNFNKRLDKGPLRPSTRLHAQLVGRFNFYDPRVPLTIR